MEKKFTDKTFNPEKYGMVFCPGCGGSGRSFVDAKGSNVCRVCGGFGLIILKRRENPYFKK